MSSSVASGGGEAVGVICGPTGAGKSAIALELALRHGLSIVVADSRQVYRGFDIGTAKPTPSEQVAVPHFGIDLADPVVRYSAAEWAASADDVLAATPRAIVVGGTGLYLRALLEGLFDEPPMDPARRTALLDWLDTLTTPELRSWVDRLDAERSHLGRTQLLRAIEVATLTGQRISDLHRSRPTGSRWRPRYLVVDPGPALHGQIEQRLDAMLAGGWPEEVAALSMRVPHDAPAWNSTGYRLLRDVHDGALGMREGRERILIDTRQYAKRQRTWFRHQLPAATTTLVDPRQPDRDAIVDRWWAEVSA